MNIGKITALSVKRAQTLEVQWDDERSCQVDLTGVIAAHPALRALSDQSVFAKVQISSDGWSIEWPDGPDFGSAQLRRWGNEQSGETMPVAEFRRWMDSHEMSLDRAAAALGLSRRTIAYYLSGEQPVPKTVMLATLGYESLKAA